MWHHYNVILENSDITKCPWQRLAIIRIISCAYVIWNILVLNIKGKVNKIVIMKNIGQCIMFPIKPVMSVWRFWQTLSLVSKFFPSDSLWYRWWGLSRLSLFYIYFISTYWLIMWLYYMTKTSLFLARISIKNQGFWEISTKLFRYCSVFNNSFQYIYIYQL